MRAATGSANGVSQLPWYPKPIDEMKGRITDFKALVPKLGSQGVSGAFKAQSKVWLSWEKSP